MKTSRHRVLAPLTLAAALTLTACSQGGQAEFESGSQPSANEQSAPADTADSGDTTDSQDDAASEEAADAPADEGETAGQNAATAPVGINPATVPDAIATVTVPAKAEHDKDATLDVSIHSLTREGKTVMGVFSFTLNSKAGRDSRGWLYDRLGDKSWAPHFIDTENLTRHDVLSGRGGARPAITDSQGSTYIQPGQTIYAYAAFAAPPEDVTSVMVSLIDGSQAVEVPIQ